MLNTQPNQPGKKKKKKKAPKIPLIDILNGKYAHYNCFRLHKRLIEEKIFQAKCYNCRLELWLGNPIPLELEHIDGNPHNHNLNNLTLLCPNCHALTPTYRGKNKH